MEIPTDEFKNKMVHARSILCFIRDNEEIFVSENFTKFINKQLKAKKLKKSQVAAESQISKTYLYELFSGKRFAPSRDVCLQLIFGLRLSIEEGDKLLRISGHASLYAKNKRDAVIIFCLNSRYDLVKTNIMLDENSLSCLVSQ